MLDSQIALASLYGRLWGLKRLSTVYPCPNNALRPAGVFDTLKATPSPLWRKYQLFEVFRRLYARDLPIIRGIYGAIHPFVIGE